MAKIVIALGGNALGKTPQQQLELVRMTAKPIADLIQNGNSVVVAHGNGPQVGMINLAMEKNEMPFPECGAMSQGYIGFHLQNAIGNELKDRGIVKEVVTLVTQVVVDENDSAFSHPTKPIGTFYGREDAEKMMKEKGFTMAEDAGRGFRRVVPSPKPVDVIEKKSIRELVDAGTVVITVGGGGIPVVERNGKLYGVPAVIDKDFASEKLAELIDADMLVILTAVEKVAVNYKKPDVKWLDSLSISEVEEYKKQGQFAEGSMLPKVEAAAMFAESKKGRIAVITSLDKALQALKGETGTVIRQ